MARRCFCVNRIGSPSAVSWSPNNFASPSTAASDKPCFPAMNRLRLLSDMPVFLAMAYRLSPLCLIAR